MKNLFIISLLTIFLMSCAEEVLTRSSQSQTTSVNNQTVSSLSSCATMQLDRPPVDILYIVDNSGSTLLSSFQAIKSQIANTINNISNEFDYHVYVVPLMPPSGSSATTYPLIVSDTNSLPSTGGLNIVSINDLSSSFFAAASGNNSENGFQRAYDIINANRSNGIFRNNANTIITMISNGDDTSSTITIGGNQGHDPNVFNHHKTNFFKLTKKYAQTNSVSNPMNAESLRFISLVPHSNCNGYKTGTNYKSMSSEIYNYMGYNDDSQKDTRDLCSGNFSSLFAAVNNSINAVITGHRFDHWLISTANSNQIQEDDITLTKVLSNGNSINIPQSSTNGFEYLGYRTNQNTRYYPTAGAPVTGLVVRLNGSARVNYPECIVAKTKTPIEYYGYAVIPREPVQNTIVVKVNGSTVPKSTSDGWSYEGYFDSKNIKIQHNGASNQPGIYKSGYFIKLNGSHIISNGDSVEVFYTPAAI